MTMPPAAMAAMADACTVPETSSSSDVVGGRCLPLSSPSDEDYLSPLVCLIRAQMEVFSATEADVQTRGQMGGLVQMIAIGRVGVRCIHCRDRPAAERAKGSVSYPASVRMLNQATRNWQRYHWVGCSFIPPSAREEFERLTSGKRHQSSRKSQEYWIRRSGEMGLVDTATVPTAPPTANEDDAVESEGIYFEEDARKLGLSILEPPEVTDSGTASPRDKAKGKKNERKEKKKKKKPTKDASTKHSHKRKSTLDPNKEDVGDARAIGGEDVPTAVSLSTMNQSSALEDIGIDASLLTELGSLLNEPVETSASLSEIPTTANAGAGTCIPQQNIGGKNNGNSMNRSLVADDPYAAGDGLVSGRGMALLSTLEAVRGMVRSLREKEDGASADGDQIAADLNSLGEALYRTLAGDESAPAASPAGVNPGVEEERHERVPKRERHRDEDRPGGACDIVPLQDLGFPTKLCIFVQSLIDATDEDAAERFTSMSEVDIDLRLMIEFPNRYLFDPPQELLTGRLCVPSGLYGIKVQQNKLMNAFQSVVETGDMRHGLALVCGRSGSGKVRSIIGLIIDLPRAGSVRPII
jgi:hypothetical protein